MSKHDDLPIENNDAAVDGSKTGLSSWQLTAVIWGVIAFGLSIFLINVSSANYTANYGLFVLSFTVMVGTATGLAGALVGDALRRFTMPSAVFTNGGMSSLLKVKIFWLIGPQSIGLLIGSIVGISLILN